MSEKLKDPSKAAHEIVEVLEDGDAIRNDGVRLTAANKNPWYVLATIYGEQDEGATWLYHDKELATKNRQAWINWSRGGRPSHEVAEIKNLLRGRLGDETAELPVHRGKADFSKTFFSRPVCFEKFEFGIECDFSKAHFAGNILFNSAIFKGNVFLIEATFKGIADFRGAVFRLSSNFRSALFEDVALFDSAIFKSNVCFQSATFCSGVGFAGAIFEGEAQFDWYEYSGVGYEKASHPVRFFGKVSFNAAKFQFKTRFNDAQFFRYVPEFHATQLYDDTVFPTPKTYTDNWPQLKGIDEKEAAEQKRAYNQLRLFMNKSLQIDEEQFFHRQEMRCKRETEGWQYRWIYMLFEGASDYGNSVLKPVWWLFVIWLSGVLAKLEAVQGVWYPDYHSIPSAMGWSFANLFSFFGFYRRYFADEKSDWVLQLFSATQTVLGFVLLFFLGLGLRNRFRLR